jgi:hypothetical protein
MNPHVAVLASFNLESDMGSTNIQPAVIIPEEGSFKFQDRKSSVPLRIAVQACSCR